ncbi:Short-chain dehydrogenase TIC 32, chloroplastic [Ananas comosus]|uniref:Short-chain dehydrogenase TIC 32, chloroplastic n=1 Tax=Ananas comosus TaxID=4615 RepID=A0A199W2M5_ANACO|nr:Short-chain dehydrogenase TIC 32, chloroplastic [Ananas comosus]
MQSIKEALRYLIGFAGPSGFGSSSTADQVTAQDSSHSIPPNLTAIITGATSGIGAETARVLAKRGLRLIIPARDVKRAAEVRERIRRESPTAEIVVIEMDLSSIASIRRFCARFLALGLPLNILMYNATTAYAQSKLANIMHAKEIARQLKGASTTCYVALSSQVQGISGKYFVDCNESSCSSLADDEIAAQNLWKETHTLVRRLISKP